VNARNSDLLTIAIQIEASEFVRGANRRNFKFQKREIRNESIELMTGTYPIVCVKFELES